MWVIIKNFIKNFIKIKFKKTISFKFFILKNYYCKVIFNFKNMQKENRFQTGN